MTDKEFEHLRWIKLFWFCVSIISFGLIFLMCLVWVPIPPDNIRFADVILGFITGSLVTGAIGYLLGGNSAPPKKEDSKTIITSDDSNVITEDTAVTLKKE